MNEVDSMVGHPFPIFYLQLTLLQSPMKEHIFPHLVGMVGDVSDQFPVLMYVASLHWIFISLRVVG